MIARKNAKKNKIIDLGFIDLLSVDCRWNSNGNPSIPIIENIWSRNRESPPQQATTRTWRRRNTIPDIPMSTSPENDLAWKYKRKICRFIRNFPIRNANTKIYRLNAFIWNVWYRRIGDRCRDRSVSGQLKRDRSRNATTRVPRKFKEWIHSTVFRLRLSGSTSSSP